MQRHDGQSQGQALARDRRSTTTIRRNRPAGWTGAWTIVIAAWFLPGDAAYASRSTCLNGTGQSAISACEQAISSAGPVADLSLALANHLRDASRKPEAQDVLELAMRRSPGNNELKKLHTIVKSEVEEEKFIAERKAQQSQRVSPALIRRNQIRCEKQRGKPALDACNALAGSFPKDAKLAARRGLLMAELGQDQNALKTLRQAKQLGTSNQAALSKLQALENTVVAAAPKPKSAAKPKPVATPTPKAKPAPKPATRVAAAPADNRKLRFDPVAGTFALR